MKVQCSFCEHQKNGLCFKKTKNGQPTSVKINKRRQCTSYVEDPMKVLAKYRKAEQHKAGVKLQEMRRARTAAAIKQLAEEQGFTSKKEV